MLRLAEATQHAGLLGTFYVFGATRTTTTSIQTIRPANTLFHNQATLNEHSRAIDIRHHAVRQVYLEGDVKVGGVATTGNHSDILTKFLAPPLHPQHTTFLNLFADPNDPWEQKIRNKSSSSPDDHIEKTSETKRDSFKNCVTAVISNLGYSCHVPTTSCDCLGTHPPHHTISPLHHADHPPRSTQNLVRRRHVVRHIQPTQHATTWFSTIKNYIMRLFYSNPSPPLDTITRLPAKQFHLCLLT
jgi:hypothetical protein